MAPDPSIEKNKPKSFEALTPELSSWILDFTTSSGFTRTTPVQAMAIPLLMGNKDLVVEAVTGSGKTLSFLIPMVERILRAEEPNKKGYVRGVVVAPTKELTSQIWEVLRGLVGFHAPSRGFLRKVEGMGDGVEDDEDEVMGDGEEQEEVLPGPYVIPQLLVGGRTKLPEDLATFSKLNPNILIGTPKRMVEVLSSSKVQLKRHWFDLLVLDEADRLLDPNFQPDLQRILELVPKERRTGLFSASVSEAVDELVRVGMRYPFKISAKVRSKSGALDKRTPESLKLYHLVTKPTHKLPMLKGILEEKQAEKSIVYVSTRAGVDYWNHVLPSLLGVSVFPVHGDHKHAIREKNLQRFRDCVTPAILLTTDVLARGIDIPDIDLVVQLDPPSQPKDFIHRCGRSGRAGKRGAAITFLHQGSEEDYIKYLDMQGTKLDPYPSPPTISDEEASATTSQIHSTLHSKHELHDRSQKAFVSWVQAYNKTLPADIFSVRKISWAELGKSWGLLRWPKMPELKKHCPEAVSDRTWSLDLPSDFHLDSIPYADKVREEKRLTDNAARARGEKVELPAKFAGKLAEARKRKERAWSAQKGAKAVREGRRERKEVRRVADKKGKMTDQQRVEARELEALIGKVRERNAREREGEEAEGVFEGFED
ncbi:hypothetical protein M409DRAFT_20552 [Zasmidium cellare ATCC 36951]|uniref:ATP-dependent RNA helicase n=1 Tax=Zasmidium cellare ATCC 36951 TaxID=1080233 RepID=A0A6A6CT18_ZASCE|nr:uncharacterized protein M409DRAFT_20552 [Zasmidium cellare ATCC 36951]KAF2169328.1 hypothetical protein M409DRAFT_20552 [Zasmidium cellare ATCC 36951]